MNEKSVDEERFIQLHDTCIIYLCKKTCVTLTVVVFQHGKCYDSLIVHINRKKEEKNEQENSIGKGFARFPMVRRLLNVFQKLSIFCPPAYESMFTFMLKPYSHHLMSRFRDSCIAVFIIP